MTRPLQNPDRPPMRMHSCMYSSCMLAYAGISKSRFHGMLPGMLHALASHDAECGDCLFGHKVTVSALERDAKVMRNA